MRLLSTHLPLALCALGVLALPLTAVQTGAHPRPEPDHGLNESDHCTLWSGDAERATPADGRHTTASTPTSNGSSQSDLCELAQWTDIPLNEPPRAVEQWNRRDLREFPETSANESIHPANATLTDGRFIQDAYARVFAVQPSTRAQISTDQQPLYVARNGSVLGTVDYRVAVPENESSDRTRVTWKLVDHEIAETRVLVDGEASTTDTGSHTPTFPYALERSSGETRTLTLEATVEVTLQKQVSVCRTQLRSGNCSSWNESAEYVSETLTVRDSVDVVPYDLTVAGYRASYPNGDLGLVVYKTKPWLGYSVPGGEVHGVWRFYSARDSDWDRLVTSNDSGRTVHHSPLHPLQVYAYPIETGPTASPGERIRILQVNGTATQPPALPPNVSLDVLTESYTASYGIATRIRTTNHDLDEVTAYGLVRGVRANASSGVFIDVPIHQSNLSLAVLNSTARTVTVQVTLTDAVTGDPIQTEGRDGYVVVDGKRVNTRANGTVTTTLSRTAGGIAARYEPGDWWRAEIGYVGDSDVVYDRGTVLRLVSVLYQALVFAMPLFVAVFLVDRITGWGIWPPWRRV